MNIQKMSYLKKLIMIGGLFALCSYATAQDRPCTTSMSDASLSRSDPARDARIKNTLYQSGFAHKPSKIDEVIFDLHDTAYFMDNRDMISQANYIERTNTWSPLYYGEAESQIMNIFKMAEENKGIIRYIDCLNSGDIPSEYAPLKHMLQKLDSIMANPGLANPSHPSDSMDKLMQVYNEMQKGLKINLLTDTLSPKMYRPANIEDLMSGDEGNCKDVVPAYYAVLKHLGFDVKMRFGAIYHQGSNRRRLHTWIHVGENFDLDPLWYKKFVPLESRLQDDDRPMAASNPMQH